jgi:hypothetical protein
LATALPSQPNIPVQLQPDKQQFCITYKEQFHAAKKRDLAFYWNNKGFLVLFDFIWKRQKDFLLQYFHQAFLQQSSCAVQCSLPLQVPGA